MIDAVLTAASVIVLVVCACCVVYLAGYYGDRMH
jgi:hypothetical protein